MFEIRLCEAPDPADGWYWQVMDVPHPGKFPPEQPREIAADFAYSSSSALVRAIEFIEDRRKGEALCAALGQAITLTEDDDLGPDPLGDWHGRNE